MCGTQTAARTPGSSPTPPAQLDAQNDTQSWMNPPPNRNTHAPDAALFTIWHQQFTPPPVTGFPISPNELPSVEEHRDLPDIVINAPPSPHGPSIIQVLS
jgi:hypothetical protein